VNHAPHGRAGERAFNPAGRLEKFCGGGGGRRGREKERRGS